MLLETRRLRKGYRVGDSAIEVLHGVDLTVEQGELVSIMGTSGSGKSTLLHILGGLMKPDGGLYRLSGRDMLEITDDEQSWIRAHWIGFVFQTFDLLPELDVLENVALPYLYHSERSRKARACVLEAIEQVGLTHRRKHRPAQLSGGELQRVAIARALAIHPKLILADEPTGNLDAGNSSEILSLFGKLNAEGTTLILVTHDSAVAAIAGRTLRMEDGCLVGGHA